MTDDYADDVDMTVNDGQLKSIADLSFQQFQHEKRISALKKELEAEQKLLIAIQQDLLPAAMEAAGLKDFALSNGVKIQVAEKLITNISEDNKPAAYQWLRDHNHGSIIKNVLSVSFGMKGDEIATKLLQELQQREDLKDQDIAQKQTIHPSTLTAFVKGQLAKQGELPESITVLPLKFAEITVPKHLAADSI